MHNGLQRYAWLALILVCSSAFGASVSDILERAAQAERRISYRGIKNASVNTGTGALVFAKMKVLHLKPDKTRTEYLAPSTLAGVVFVRNSRNTYRYDPHQKRWQAIGRCPVYCDDELLDNLRKHYNLRLLDIQQAAGRDAYLIAAEPRRKFEPVHQLLIDKETYLVVAAFTTASDGKYFRAYKFVSLELNPKDIRPSLFDVPASVSRSEKHDTRPNFKVMKPSYLPVGYKLVGEGTSRMNNLLCSHLRFSNGVNTISLFQRPARNSSNHPAHLFRTTNVVTWTKDGMLLTLVGDISQEELEKIARSVR